MKLSTRLTIFLNLLIIVVLTGYGYFHVLSRRDNLFRKMQTEVLSTGRTLKVALEKISILRETEYVQELIDAVEAYEKTLGVIVYHEGKNIVFRSRSVQQETESYLDVIKRSMKEDSPMEGFGTYKGISIFFYGFPLKDARGNVTGGVSILQHTSFMEKDITKAQWEIFTIILLLMAGTAGGVLYILRRSLHRPMSILLVGIKSMAEGNLETRIALKRSDELAELAEAFNHMTTSLRESQARLIREGEIRLDLERSLLHSEKLATIGQLASGLAHEIGTPLNIISGRAEFIKRRLQDKESIRKNLHIIAEQTERITRSIRQFLGFARKKKPDQGLINLPTLIETTLDLLDHQIQKQGIEVSKEMKGDLLLAVGDADQLQQVFLNIILNALQAMPQGGKLRICASSKRISKENLGDREREYLEIGIEDTGIGMEREVMEKVFQPFFTTKDQGTGLGLMVSQGIIQDHEGWIEVESEAGNGSLFRVYLPSFSKEVKKDG